MIQRFPSLAIGLIQHDATSRVGHFKMSITSWVFVINDWFWLVLLCGDASIDVTTQTGVSVIKNLDDTLLRSDCKGDEKQEKCKESAHLTGQFHWKKF